jgi:hypothetical protein
LFLFSAKGVVVVADAIAAVDVVSETLPAGHALSFFGLS